MEKLIRKDYVRGICCQIREKSRREKIKEEEKQAKEEKKRLKKEKKEAKKGKGIGKKILLAILILVLVICKQQMIYFNN